MKRLLSIVFAAVLAGVWGCSSSGTGTTGSTGTTTGASGTTASGTTGTTDTGTTASGSTTASAPEPANPSGTTETPRTGETSTMSTATSAATTAASAAGVDVAGSLGSTLGLTPDQSAGAVGAVMSLAQQKLPASDYSKVATSVPNSSGYIQKAKDLGAIPETGVADKSGLDAAYAKLGISPQVASQVTPLVVQYAGKLGGPTVQGLLSGVLQ